MQISPLNIKLNFNNNISKLAQKNYTTQQNIDYQSDSLMYNPKNYISFAGYSTNLKQSIEELAQAEALNNKKHLPERVKALALTQIKNGNPEDLTLIDIHKQAYSDIMLAENIDDVKEKFPEFNNVKSIYELDFEPQKGSFLREVIDGQNKYFDNAEDLSLQLLKLYWGEGYSLSALADYTKIEQGKLYSAMRNLNIPRVSTLYGSILKRSDKDFSARLAETFALKYAQRFEQMHGHIHIPVGPLSQEHKQKISQSLINYYIENPDRAYLQTSRVRDFYNKNIYASEIFTTVLKEAWNLSSSNQVKKELQAFFKAKAGQKLSDEQLVQTESLKSSYRLLMQEFWQTHPKAKKDFSRSMKSAWVHINKRLEAEKNAEFSSVSLFPKQIAAAARAHFVNTGRPVEDCILCLVAPHGGNAYTAPIKGSKTLYNFLLKNPEFDKLLATSLMSTFMHTKDLIKNSKEPLLKDIRNEIFSIEQQACGAGISTNFALNYYLSMCRRLAKSDKTDLLYKIKVFYELFSFNIAQNALKGDALGCELVSNVYK